MALYLDGKPLSINKHISAEQLLPLINEKLKRQGRVLQQLLINGQNVEGDWLRALRNFKQEDVSFISLPASQVLRDAILHMVELLPQLAAEITQAARFLQTGADAKAFPLLSTSVNGLESYMQLLTLLPQYLPAQDAQTQKHVAFLAEWLQKLMAAWQGEDFVLMADYLLYEIEPQLRRGQTWLAGLVAVN